MTIAGAGAGINELTALAVTSELAPTRQRGKYVAFLVFTIIPFCPSVLWGQLIASHSSWRYCGALCGAWAAVGLIMTIVFYFPPPRVNSQGLTRSEIIKQIDFVGGLLSIAGMLLFMMGLQWGGYQYAWSSPHVLVCLLLGVALLVAFVVWEASFAKFPMYVFLACPLYSSLATFSWANSKNPPQLQHSLTHFPHYFQSTGFPPG